MSKRILTILAAVMAFCLTLAFTACGEEKDINLSADNSAAISVSNGGFLAETEDYVYFINGSETYTVDNTKGSVEKGALVRLPKSALGTKDVSKKGEVVVSKLLSTTDYNAGIAIIGDRIYFASPSAEEDKTGNVQYDDIVFYSAKLNGQDVKEIATCEASTGNASVYKFVEVGGKAYVVFLSDEEVDHATKKYINVVGADGAEIAKEEYDSYVFEAGSAGDHIYFTRSVKDKVDENVTESFNEVYRMKIGGKAEKILYGAGSDQDDAANNIKYEDKGVQGVKFTLVAAENDYVYISVVNVDTSVSTNTFYAFLKEDAQINDAEAGYKALLGNIMTRKGDTKIFAATSIYHAPDCIVYLDSAAGLYCYNYTNENDYFESNGLSLVYDSTTFRTATLGEIKGNYLYYHVSGVYYKLEYTVNGNQVTVGDEEIRLSPVTFATDWYSAEVVSVGGKDYVLGTLPVDDYHSYVMAFGGSYTDDDYAEKIKDLDESIYNDIKAVIDANITDKDDKADALKALDAATLSSFLVGADRANVYYNWEYNRASVVTGDNDKTVKDYFDNTYPDGEVEEEVEEDGCSSFAGAGAALGVAMLALGAVALKKRG